MAENDTKTDPGLSSAPSAKDVEQFHTNSDADVRPQSQHHTIGVGPNQAAAGDHNHYDGKSAQLFAGKTITGSKTNGTALASVIQILVDGGAVDASTA